MLTIKTVCVCVYIYRSNGSSERKCVCSPKWSRSKKGIYRPEEPEEKKKKKNEHEYHGEKALSVEAHIRRR